MGEKKKVAQPDRRALYRKYRSKSLAEIVGQEHVTKTLENAIKTGKISHAYLFTGPKGVGKTSIARILAHEINKIPYIDDATHLDIIEIDAASNRRIDDIRDLREKVNLAPVNAEYKVYIIDEVHMLTPESFNALLKTLEEPPAHVVFILATTEMHKLPATIVSRTQRHTFRSVPVDQAAAHLRTIAGQEEIAIEDEALTLIARHGEGGLRDSISLLDQISHLPQPVTQAAVEELLGMPRDDEIASLLEEASAGNTESVIKQLRTLEEQGISPVVIAKQLVAATRKHTPNHAMLTLLRDLLEVGSSSYPAITLETALLALALSQHTPPPAAETPIKKVATVSKPTSAAAPVTKVSTSVSKEEVKAEAPPKALTKNAPPEEKPKKPVAKKQATEASEALEEFWPDVLQEVKEQNSSLYTVMRLAKPSLNNETLTLGFQFPFHQKRMQDIKNITLMANITSNFLNFTPVIETVVDASLKKSQPVAAAPAPTPDPAHASLIAGIQDMMGGGEIVDAHAN